MNYLLARAEQELDVYFKKVTVAEFAGSHNGNPLSLYTFLLKGREKPSVASFLKTLCSRGQIISNDCELLIYTQTFFNNHCKGSKAIITSSIGFNGKQCYTLKTSNGLPLSEEEQVQLIRKLPKLPNQNIPIPNHYWGTKHKANKSHTSQAESAGPGAS